MQSRTPVFTNELRDALAKARRSLLDARTPDGHWEGELSSSALSTATAVFALSLYREQVGQATDAPAPGNSRQLIDAGIDWLIRHQNADGGWGDTTLSVSNISTTALCWAALGVAGERAGAAGARAQAWLARAAGSLDRNDLARAIADRYGKDRTFSVPILTMCALAGRLGDARRAWGLIPQLPFELAALPRSWFQFLRLPVVSYALPALISMGLLRHRRRPTRNPIARLVRRAVAPRVLRVLEDIQPAGGGFLEATPLTSFVAMSLIGAGLVDHPVVASAVDFLVRSARPDGSWAIDTNLATWVTTLSINALAAGDGIDRGPAAVASVLSVEERRAVRDWLLAQQYRARHPYTGAAPGGWAWTNLPGGVPDADDTAGALLALFNLADPDERVFAAASAGVRWLLQLQNRDGGIPTFCRGWTNLPFDRSGPDLTAHALLAWSAWRPHLPAELSARIVEANRRAVAYLAAQQRPDGAWAPLWFGNQFAPDDENLTYGTARVLPALCDPFVRSVSDTSAMTRAAVSWLLRAQNQDGGWGGGADLPSSTEETGAAVHALGLAAEAMTSLDSPPARSLTTALASGTRWLIARIESDRPYTASPIGLYFAKLWYFEALYPTLFAVSALGTNARAGSASLKLA